MGRGNFRLVTVKGYLSGGDKSSNRMKGKLQRLGYIIMCIHIGYEYVSIAHRQQNCIALWWLKLKKVPIICFLKKFKATMLSEKSLLFVAYEVFILRSIAVYCIIWFCLQNRHQCLFLCDLIKKIA